MGRENLLMIADSEHDADMLYAVGLLIPEPFIYLRIRGKCQIVLGELAVDRIRGQGSNCRVLPLSRYTQKLAQQGRRFKNLGQVAGLILKETKLRKIYVPHGFPFGLARQLRRQQVKVKLREGAFFPQRSVKSAEEVKKISAAGIMAEVGLSEGIQALKSSRVGKDDKLIYRNALLTREKLRSVIETAIIQAGGVASQTVIESGRANGDQPDRGTGALRANEAIVLDIQPRSRRTGYFGHIIRTVVKGQASESVRRMHEIASRAQNFAFAEMRHGRSGADIHSRVLEYFDGEGFRTWKQNGKVWGCANPTGQGIGLESCEYPLVAPGSPDTLEMGNVLTVGPGLCFPGEGMVRLGDVAHVSANSTRNLTKFEKILEV